MQVQVALGVQMADVWRIAKCPQHAARDAHAHQGDLGCQVGADRRDVDLATEAGDREVDREQAHVELEVQRAPDRRGKSWPAAEHHADASVEVQRPDVDVELGLAVDLELTVGAEEAADVDDQEVEEVEVAVKLDLEDRVDHADPAVEIDVEGQDVQHAGELEVEIRLARDDVVRGQQRLVIEVAGVDPDRCVGLDADDRDAEVQLGLDQHREVDLVVGIDAKRRSAVDLQLGKADVERDTHRRLDALAVDQQVNRPLHRQRSDVDRGKAGDPQQVRVNPDLHRIAVVVVDLALSISPAHLLLVAGGVDLHHEPAADAENAAVHDDRVGVAAADVEAAIQTRATVDRVDHQTDRAGDAQWLEQRQRELGRDTEFQCDRRPALGDDDREIALERERAAEQVEAALAGQRSVHAGPAVVLARRLLADREGVEAGDRSEGLRDDVGDVATEGVERQLKFDRKLGDRAQVELVADVQTQCDAAAVDHHQTGGVAVQVEAVGADLQVDVGKHRQAVAGAEAEVEHALHRDQAEHVHLGLAEHAQEQLVVLEHDRVVGVAGLDRVTGMDDALGVFPGALGEVDDGQVKGSADIALVRHRAGLGVGDDLAQVELETRAQVDLDRDVLGLESHARNADQTDHVDRYSTGKIDADADALEPDHELLGDDQPDIEVFNRQAHCRGIDIRNVKRSDAAVVVVVDPIATHTHEGIGIGHADRHRGDDGLLAIGQRDRLGPPLGEGHRAVQLQEAADVDRCVADLGLDDLRIEVDEHRVAAARRQRETGQIHLAALVLVLGQVQHTVVVLVLASVEIAVEVDVFAVGVEHTVVVAVLGVVLEARADLVVDRRRPKQLDGRVDLGRPFFEQEGVDVDLNIFGDHRHHRRVDADQTGFLDRRLGREERRAEILQTGDGIQQLGLHHRQAEIDVVDHHADRVLVDAVEQAIGHAKRPGQVLAIAVRAVDAGKAAEVGTAQRHRVDIDDQRVEVDACQLGDVVHHRPKAAHVDRDGEDFALAESQRTPQEQEVGHRDVGQADVQPHQLGALEVQVDRRAACLDPIT